MVDVHYYLCRGSSVVERFSEKEEVASSILARGTALYKSQTLLAQMAMCGCGIVAITRPCQGRDGGSIPLTRSTNSSKIIIQCFTNNHVKYSIK